MPELNIENIRENSNFETTQQYQSFNEMAEEFLFRQLMEELNEDAEFNR